MNNPECYKENGTIKKGARFKRPSNRQLRLRNRRRKVYRSLSEERKKLQGQLVNRLVSQASIIRIEELNVKGLQKRSRDIRINPKTINLIVRSVLEKPFLEPLQVASELLLKQELSNSVLNLKSFHQKT